MTNKVSNHHLKPQAETSTECFWFIPTGLGFDSGAAVFSVMLESQFLLSALQQMQSWATLKNF